MEAWVRAVLRFRFPVLALWFLVLGLGAWSWARLPPLLTNELTVPGTDSERARTILARAFDERPDGTFVVVFRDADPADEALAASLERRLETAAARIPTGRVRSLDSGAGILYGEIRTRLDLRQAKLETPALRRALQGAGPPATYVTGQPAIQYDLDELAAADLRRGEALALVAAIVVLVAAFGASAAVAIPFLVAACTIAATLALLYTVAHALPVATYVTNLVVLLGLALAIDYSLLIVYRFREEIADGHPLDEAIVRTMRTAGRAVLISGSLVAVGLGLLLSLPVPFIRSLGVGGFLIPLASVLAALTLQPVLLFLLGARSARPLVAGRLWRGWLARGRNGHAGAWERLARAVLQRPRLFLAGGTSLLVVAAAPALWLQLSPGSISALPGSLESTRGFALLRDDVGAGAVTPIHVVVDTGGRARAGDSGVDAAFDRLGRLLFDDHEVAVIADGTDARYVDSSGRYRRMVVVGRHEYGDRATRALVGRLRERLVPAARFPAGAEVFVGGAPAQGVDFVERAYGAFPWLILATVTLTFFVLLRAFRSLVLPVKAVLVNLATLAAVYGILVVAFQWGFATRVLGLHPASEIEAWIPIFLFALLFGLSTDYEVFVVMRMRESWDAVADNGRAVVHGLQRTGPLITAAGAVMVAAFSGFVVGRVSGLQQFGLGLALAIVIDVTIVRGVLVPSAMAVLERYNWWLPARVARVVGVSPSPLTAREESAG
jgi:uncharacterized membrane protein YdfJ with MMPL/SSD domain